MGDIGLCLLTLYEVNLTISSMKPVRCLVMLFLFITINQLALGQKPNFPYTLSLFNNVLPVLTDSSNAAIGFNHKLNDYKGFDGNVVQLGVRAKPFSGKKNLLSHLEAGVFVTGYFHQKFYWVNACCSGAIHDQATSGYETGLFLSQRVDINNVAINFSVAPRINLVYGNSLQYINGRYYYHKEYFQESEDHLGWTATFSIKYKNLEGWASYQHNIIDQSYINWGNSNNWENSPNYLLDPSKTYFYKLFLSWTGHSPYNIRYGISWNQAVKKGSIRLYSFANYWHIGAGLQYTRGRLSLNPEYHVFPAQLSRHLTRTGHQFGTLVSYNMGKGFIPHYSLQYSASTQNVSPLRSNIGLLYKF